MLINPPDVTKCKHFCYFFHLSFEKCIALAATKSDTHREKNIEKRMMLKRLKEKETKEKLVHFEKHRTKETNMQHARGACKVLTENYDKTCAILYLFYLTDALEKKNNKTAPTIASH